MATTAQKSDQLTNRDATPMVQNLGTDLGGKLRFMNFTFTQSGAGDAGSTVDLFKLPAGRHRILLASSRVAYSAWGASRTLDIGHTAYTDLDGDAVTADPDALTGTGPEDVSSAGVMTPSNAANSVDSVLIESKEEVLIQGVVAGGTIPDGATLAGYFVYVTE